MHNHNHQCACGHHQGEGGCCRDHQRGGIERKGPASSDTLLTMTEEEERECACGGYCGCCEDV